MTMNPPGVIELRLLGALSLIGSDGKELPTVLRQPKRLALLAYLVVASPRGFHRRDTLLTLFWPERDTEHARAALSDALYDLRRTLGGGVIVSRGDEEVALAGSGCWCDAVAVEDAVEAGRLEEAIYLYRGEFLAGFHLSDAPEFDRWLDGVRVRLRERAKQAASVLADQEAAAGRPAVAVRWARHAVGLSPYEENGLRQLVALLDRMGSRAEAVLEYERFAQRLASDLDLEPSAETIGLMESIRKRRPAMGERRAERSAGHQSGPKQPGRAIPAPPVGPTAQPAVRRYPRLLPLALVLVALATVLLVVRGVTQRRPPVSPAAIAVLPFAYRGRPEFSYLAEGMVNLLSVKLDGATGVRPVDPRALLRFVSRSSGSIDPEHAALVAQHFGADLFVLGSITEAGGRLDLSATVYDARRPRNSFEVTAGEPEIFDAADRLAREILAEVQDEPLRLARVAGQSTSSLPALKAYLEAEREIRAARWGSAEEALHQAVALDTSFALAYYRLAELTYADNGPLAREMVEHALRHRDRLGEHYGGLVLAMADFLRGAHTAADQRFRQIVAVHPDDADAWYMLAQITQRKGHLMGRAWVDAREPYERVLALDPRNAIAVWWLAAIAAREGRRSELDSLTDRLFQLHPEPFFALSARGQRAIVFGDTAQEAAYRAELRTRKDLWAQMNGGLVTFTTMNLPAGRRLWHLLTEPSRSPSMRLLAHTVLAKLELTGGRRGAAAAELAAAEALDPGVALEHRAVFALSRFLNPPASELIALRDSLRRWNPLTTRTGGAELPAIPAQIHPYIKLYLLGMLSARLRDDAAARRYAEALERPGRSSLIGRFAADEADAVRGEAAWMSGRREEALAKVEQAQFWTNDSGLEEMGDSPFTTHLHERFARAELLYQLGREHEALAWYRPLAHDFLYTASAELREAEIYQHEGDRESAKAHYARFLELWSDCDTDLEPKVHQAREALDELR